MSRRRPGRWSHGESFGASLADILTTALGCVLLLFLVAVLSARITLSRERSAHTSTQAQLFAESQGRKVAEVEKQVVQGQKSAIEQALEQALAAKGQLENALKASEDTNKSLQSDLAGHVAKAESLAQQLAQAQQALASEEQRYSRLREAAAAAVEPAGSGALPDVDLLLVVDATASMAPSLEAVRSELKSLITALGVVSAEPRVGVSVFRDSREAPDFRIEALPPTGDISTLATFLDGIRAASTKVDIDMPEWLSGGMAAAKSMPMRPNALRLMVVVSDAGDQTAHSTPDAIALASAFRESGGRVFVVSTVPAAAERKPEIALDYTDNVLPQHARIAQAGGGTHIPEAGSEALVREVLRAVLSTRDTSRTDKLRTFLETQPE